MKSKIAVALLVTSILVSIAAASYVGITGGFSSHGFTLTALGKAFDVDHHQFVTVKLSLRGTTYGSSPNILHLYVNGGDLRVEDYGTYPISRSSGTAIHKYHFVWLTVKTTAQYGGTMSVWHLSGRTGTWDDKKLSVSLYASRVTLPIAGHPQLVGLWLKGTIMLD